MKGIIPLTFLPSQIPKDIVYVCVSLNKYTNNLFLPLFLKAGETRPLKSPPLKRFNIVIEILLDNYFRKLPCI